VLQGAGDLTEICHNGPSALETAKDFDPDIIFLDIILPVIDGYEVCKQLRTQTKRDNLIIVAQSGIGDTALEAEQRGACFDVHLSKPVDLRQVVSIVNDVRQTLKANWLAGSKS
jgi:CheY-like chemotaxis protein